MTVAHVPKSYPHFRLIAFATEVPSKIPATKGWLYLDSTCSTVTGQNVT